MVTFNGDAWSSRQYMNVSLSDFKVVHRRLPLLIAQIT